MKGRLNDERHAVFHSAFRIHHSICRRVEMRANLVRGFGGAVLALLVIVLCMSVAHSQQRKRTSRRVTHPARPRPVETPVLPNEPSVVSTADEQPAAPRRNASGSRQGANTQAENEQLRGTVKDLSTQVEKLNGELNQMKTDQRAMHDLE